MDKATAKLIEVVASGIGAIAAPWITRRNARADLDRARFEAQAKLDAKGILEGTKVFSEDGKLVDGTAIKCNQASSEEAEINNRISFQETKRQHNLHAITAKASENLDDEVDDKEVDPDWIARFFGYAQDVTQEEMQILWSKVLAGEVSKPGSYSLMTLEVLRKLSRADARAFQQLSPFLVADALYTNSKVLLAAGISYDSVLYMDELGLLRASFGLMKQFHNQAKEGFKTTLPIITKKGWGLSVVGSRAAPYITLDACLLTRVGREIVPMIQDVEPNLDYLREVANKWKKDGYQVDLLKPGGPVKLA